MWMGFVADPLFSSKSHGGMASYVNLRLFPYITNIRFTKCTLSFSFSILPGFCFMLVYLYPRDSPNFELNDFGILSEEISFWINKGFVPYLGGDYNSRLGDINILSQRSMKWRYTQNVDLIVIVGIFIFIKGNKILLKFDKACSSSLLSNRLLQRTSL